jgi:hypothetical protein
MKKFFYELVSGDSETSSKRFSAMFTLLNLLILTYLAAWKSGWITPEFMFNTLALVVGGGLGLTVLEKIFKKDTPVVPPTPPEPEVVPEPVTENDVPKP